MASATYRYGKKGLTVRLRVSDGYDREGHQVIRSMSYKPDPALKGAALEMDVERAARNFEERVTGVYSAGAAGQSLSEYSKEYLRIQRGHLTESTCFAYEKIINTRILPSLGQYRLCDIGVQEIRRFVDGLADDNARQDCLDGGLNPRTIQKIYSVLRSIFAQAVRQDLIEQSPCRSDKIKLPEAGGAQVQFYSPAEAAAMLTCLQRSDTRWKAMIELALFTGMRRGELLALTWDDITWESGAVRVTKSAYKLTGNPVKMKDPKTKQSVRTLFVTEPIKQQLMEWQEQQDLWRPRYGAKWNPGNLMFTGKNGRAISPDCFSALWRQFLEKNNLPHKKLHSLRHSTATLLLSEGLSLADVSAQLGHSNLKTTAIYTHALPDSSRRAAAAMEHLLCGDGRFQ